MVLVLLKKIQFGHCHQFWPNWWQGPNRIILKENKAKLKKKMEDQI